MVKNNPTRDDGIIKKPSHTTHPLLYMRKTCRSKVAKQREREGGGERRQNKMLESEYRK